MNVIFSFNNINESVKNPSNEVYKNFIISKIIVILLNFVEEWFTKGLQNYFFHVQNIRIIIYINYRFVQALLLNKRNIFLRYILIHFLGIMFKILYI